MSITASCTTPSLAELAGLAPDNSLRQARTAEVLDWLARVAADRQDLPAGPGLSALMWILADEQRRNELRREMPDELRSAAERLLADTC